MSQDLPLTKLALRFGVMFGIISGIYSIILLAFELEQDVVFTTVSYLLIVLAVTVSLKEYKKENEGYLSFGQGLNVGTLVTAVMGLIGTLLSTFYTHVIDNAPLKRGSEMVRIDLEKRGLDDAAIEAALKNVEMFQSPGMMFLLGIVSFTIMGFLISLIVSAFVRKSRPIIE